jgi:hypothetical protein
MSQTQQAKEKAIRIVPIINLNNRKKQSNEMTKLSSIFTLLAVFASSTEAFAPAAFPRTVSGFPSLASCVPSRN